MTSSAGTRLGFLTNDAAGHPYHDRFKAMVPASVALTYGALSMYAAAPELSVANRAAMRSYREGATGAHIAKAQAFVESQPQDAIGLLGAPMQAENPDFLDRYREAFDIPVTTAMEAASTALRALSIQRVLLLTPFDVAMNQLLVTRLAGAGIEAIIRDTGFDHVKIAERLSPDEVHALAVEAFGRVTGVEAIYFQGGVLDPLQVIDTLEQELGVPVVASNPSMLWHLLSTLGQKHSVPGLGRLLREWPVANA